MNVMGLFVDVILDKDRFKDRKALKRLVDVCPVDIFKVEGEDVVVVPENEDECILCNLCVDASPGGGVVIRRKYVEGSP